MSLKLCPFGLVGVELITNKAHEQYYVFRPVDSNKIVSFSFSWILMALDCILSGLKTPFSLPNASFGQKLASKVSCIRKVEMGTEISYA